MHTVLIGVMLLSRISDAALNWQLNQDSGQNMNLCWSFRLYYCVCNRTLAINCMLHSCVFNLLVMQSIV